RGRDHGLADYNTTRAAYGLPRVRTFSDITTDRTTQAKLKTLYGSVDNIDLWIGGLAEDHVRESSVGPLFQRIIVDQFMRLRSGDRNWYETTFTGRELGQLRSTRLSDVLRRNTSLRTLQHNVFVWNESVEKTNQLQGPSAAKPRRP
ncbi:MAG: peroxidase, partial [Actinobacteria bacterium]|nr:peroxidase [Actinomycetota bacterium]